MQKITAAEQRRRFRLMHDYQSGPTVSIHRHKESSKQGNTNIITTSTVITIKCHECNLNLNPRRYSMEKEFEASTIPQAEVISGKHLAEHHPEKIDRNHREWLPQETQDMLNAR